MTAEVDMTAVLNEGRSRGGVLMFERMVRSVVIVLVAAMALVGLATAAAPESLKGVYTSFSDVPTTHPFYGEIEWLAITSITTGYPDGTFRPAALVERQAMAAFMYRLVGSPAFTPPATASFPDVPVGAPFRLEIEWMKHAGITTGYSDGTFRPTATVDRGAMAAFLYRLAGSAMYPATAAALAGTVTQFTDVSFSHPFYLEITWLAAIGVTTGYSDGTFRPSTPVARDAMAAFMCRMNVWWGGSGPGD